VLSYRLDELGWVQFERLCDELLGLPADVWEGRADRGRTAVAADGVVIGEQRFPGPIVAKAAWGAEPLLTLTRAEEVLRLGPAGLSALLDERPDIRRRVPSVLGVRELDELIPPAVLARSSGDVDAARSLASVFVPTRAYGRTLDVLERHSFAVVTGPPEMGKTAIARMIGLALLTEGWELHECTRPEQLWEAYSNDRQQVFIADDAFGSTEYRPEAAERWALELDRVLHAMDTRHWLIWTSRPSPLKAGLRRIHREHGVERFPQPAQVHVEASALDVEEKALILYRHARAAGLRRPAIALVRRYGWSIVEHPHFTPERIRRFVGDRLPMLARVGNRLGPGEIGDAVSDEIQEPTRAMQTSLRALPAEHRALLVALLDTAAGAVPERELTAAARRHADAAFSKPPAELLDRLTDHFLRIVPPTSVTWIHPSWRDLVIEELAADAAARLRFLEHCSLDGALLALSVQGGIAGERMLPLLVADADWDAVGGRLHELVPELADDELFRLLTAVREAVAQAPSPLASGEALELARAALRLTSRRWDGTAVSATLLDAWLALAARVPYPPDRPELAPTWIELVPTSCVDVTDAAALYELDEWLRLVAILDLRARDALDTFGFPRRQAPVLETFLADATSLTGAAAPTRGLAAQCAERLADTAPAFAPRAHELAYALRRREDPEPAPGRPEPFVPAHEASLVARILDDL
jgi:hypothetical protein